MTPTHTFTACPSARLLYVHGAPWPDGTPVTVGRPAHLPRLHSRQRWATTDGRAWYMVEAHELTACHISRPATE